MIVNERTVNWTIVAYPTLPWARLCYPDLDDDAALARLWQEVMHVSRLDEPDPLAAWERAHRRARACGRGDERRRLRRRSTSRARAPISRSACCRPRPGGWPAGRRSTASGTCRTCRARRSSPRRTRSASRATCARRSRSCSRTARSCAGSRSASRAAGRSRSTPTRAPRCCAAARRSTTAPPRLGEVALVDRESRIGQLGTVFYETLLDENAASHIALGSGFSLGGRDRRGPRARQPERRAHRLHDRRQRRRRHRRDEGRRARAGPARRRLAALSGPRRLTPPPARRPTRRARRRRRCERAARADRHRLRRPRHGGGRTRGRGRPRTGVARRFVDVTYFDPRVKRARIERADGDTLGFVPPWYGDRVRELGRCHSARVVVDGAVGSRTRCSGLDPERLGRDQLPALAEWMDVLGDRTVNWTIVPYPTMAWARIVYPELDDEAAFEQLHRDVVHVCRLDEPDPAAAWRSRCDELSCSRRTAERARARRAALRGRRHRPDGRPACRARPGSARCRRRSTGSSICRTCRPRRCSRPRIPSASRASCARRSRSCSWTARSCEGSRFASRAAAPCRSTPRKASR